MRLLFEVQGLKESLSVHRERAICLNKSLLEAQVRGVAAVSVIPANTSSSPTSTGRVQGERCAASKGERGVGLCPWHQYYRRFEQARQW